ncbi:MAG TPA: ankyrin repeat domain-containing protein [Vicinamibacterales bacterium]
MMRNLSMALMAVACCAALAVADVPTSIVEAAQQGDRATVESLLGQGANVNATDGDGATALHYAAWRGDAALAETLLAHGANVHATTTLGGYTALDLAAQVGSGPIVALLIRHGANPNAATKTGTTPLMLAAGAGDVAGVEALLTAGADPNATETEFGQTPLMFAVDRDRLAVVQVLLKHGADRNAATTVTDLAAYSKDGVDPDGRNLPALGRELEAEQGGTARPKKAKPAVPGVDRPYFQNELVGSRGGMTPLLFAVRQGYADITKVLLDAGVDVNQLKGGDHSSALLVATVNGHFDLGKTLIARGADVNLANDANVTPLYATINLQWHPRSYYPQPQAYLHQQITYLDYMKLLLDKGARPNVRLTRGVWFFAFNSDQSSIDATGATPFWRAAYGADVDAMKLLIQYGADPTLGTLKPPTRRFGAKGAAKADPSGLAEVPVGGPDVSPLLAATGEAYGWSFTANSHRYSPAGMLPAVKYLVEVLHADVNQRDADGNTPLHNAASRGDNEMIMYLVSKGADVAAMNRNGQSVADMANGPYQRTQPFPQTVALLRKLGARIVHECVTCK